jgi:hypothetical protein
LPAAPYTISTALVSLLRINVFIIIFCLVSFTSFDQPLSLDSLNQKGIINNYKQYASQVGGNLLLYNGAEYAFAYPGMQGFPFFNSANFESGTVCFNHIVYYQVPLQLDLLNNVLITKSRKDLSIMLDAKMVDSFLISNHLFIYLSADSIAGLNSSSGYYERLYNGNTKVYIKRRKQPERSFRAEDPYIFKEYDDYFIFNGNRYFKIEKKKDISRAFKNHYKETGSFLKSARINFKKDKGKYLTEAAIYYDHFGN